MQQRLRLGAPNAIQVQFVNVAGDQAAGGAGDGGLITTRDAELAEKIRILRMHGSKQKYHHDVLGTNSRLDALQAAVLRVKLRHLAKWTAGRQGRAAGKDSDGGHRQR